MIVMAILVAISISVSIIFDKKINKRLKAMEEDRRFVNAMILLVKCKAKF